MIVTDEELQEIATGMVDEAYRDLIHERMGQLETLEDKLEGYEDIPNHEAEGLAERLEAILKAEYDERLANRASSVSELAEVPGELVMCPSCPDIAMPIVSVTFLYRCPGCSLEMETTSASSVSGPMPAESAL